MAKSESTLSWNEIDASSLPEAVMQEYTAYKARYAEMKAQRQAFEAALNNHAASAGVIDETQELAVAYNFGKLSVAIAPKRERKVSKKAIALGDLS